MTPSKSQGRLYDVTVHCIKPLVNQVGLTLAPLANSLALFIGEEHQQKGQTEVNGTPSYLL